LQSGQSSSNFVAGARQTGQRLVSYRGHAAPEARPLALAAADASSGFALPSAAASRLAASAAPPRSAPVAACRDDIRGAREVVERKRRA
jgi:hypothetical protein